MPNKMPSIAAMLQRELASIPGTLNALATQLGLPQSVLWRVAHGQGGVQLATAEILLAHFGYRLVKDAPPKTPAPKPAAAKVAAPKAKKKPPRV